MEFDIALDDRGHWELNTDSAYFFVGRSRWVCFFVFFRWFLLVGNCVSWFIGLIVGAYFLESPPKLAQNFWVVSWATSYQL